MMTFQWMMGKTKALYTFIIKTLKSTLSMVLMLNYLCCRAYKHWKYKLRPRICSLDQIRLGNLLQQPDKKNRTFSVTHLSMRFHTYTHLLVPKKQRKLQHRIHVFPHKKLLAQEKETIHKPFNHIQSLMIHCDGLQILGDH